MAHGSSSAAEPVSPVGLGGYTLAVGLIVATTVAVLAGDWIGGAEATVLVGVVAVAEAILLGRAGVGRLGAALLAIPLCAAVVVPITIGLLPASVSRGGFEHSVGEYLLQALAGLLSTGANDYVQWAFIVGLSTIIWLCGYWLGWMAFRERRGVLAVLPALVVLGVNVVNAPSVTTTSGPGSSVGLAETIALLAVVAVMGVAELGSLASGWRARRVPTLEGLRGRYTSSVAVTGIAVVVASLFIPSISSADLSGGLFSGPRGNGSGGGGSNTIGFNPVVTPGGPLVSDPQPVLSYYTDQGRDAYLMAVEDTVFSDGNWLPSFDARVPSGSLSQPIAAGPIPLDPTALGGARSTNAAHITYSGGGAAAATRSGGGDLALFPGVPATVGHASIVVGEAAGRASGGSETPAVHQSISIPAGASPTYSCVGNTCYCHGTLCPTLSNLPAAGFESVDGVILGGGNVTEITDGGSVSAASASQLEAAGTVYPSFVAADAAPLLTSGAGPAALGQANEILQLAKQWTSGLTNPYAEAAAIENHLRGSLFQYTLSPPPTPSGQWPIVYFLETSHQGYCQYFASAMGAMLRSLGIPTRLVSGYGPGTPNGQFTSAHQPIYEVSTNDAHVWVEVYFPGYGWVPFEPTPPSAYGAYAPFSRGGPSAAASSAAAPSVGNPHKPLVSLPPTASSSGGGASGPAGWLLGFAIVLAVAVVLGLAALAWWPRPRSLGGVWRRLAVAGRMVGVRPDPAETRRDFVGRLAHALGGGGPPLVAGELEMVAALTGKAEFSPQGLDDADRSTWVRTWAALAPQLRRLLRRRLLRRRAAV